MTTKYNIGDRFFIPYKINKIIIDSDGLTCYARPVESTVEFSDTLVVHPDGPNAHKLKIGDSFRTRAVIQGITIDNSEKVFYDFETGYSIGEIIKGRIREEFVTYYINKSKEEQSNAET